MTTVARARPLFDPPLVNAAIKDSFIKLAPWVQWRNPVMFVVLVGSMLITGLWLAQLAGGLSVRGSPRFHPRNRAVALGDAAVRQFRREPCRGPRQGPGRRVAIEQARHHCAPLTPPAAPTSPIRACPRAASSAATWCWSKPVTRFRATARSSRASLRSMRVRSPASRAPVIREAGGDRSAVTGGTRVLSDWLVVRITANPGETFLDRMIAMVEGAKRQKTPNEIALDILLAGLTADLSQDHRDAAAVLDLQRGHGRPGRADLDHGAGGTAGVPDSDHHRRTAVGDRHRRHGSHDPGQRDRDLGPRGRGGRRRRRAAARQDRHHHARQPPGRRASFRPRASASPTWPMRHSWPRWPTKPPKAARSWYWPSNSMAFAAATSRLSERSSSPSAPRPA